jgi:4-amino-4-deoxy-L-arabinose transferase-like glycosyltransferase
VFSLSKGIFHAYYTVQLAPAVAALAGAGAVALWELGRRHRAMTWTLPAAIAATAALAVALLRRTPSWFPWLRGAIVVTALVAIVGIVAGRALRHRALVIIAGALATVALLAGPAAYSLTTAAHSEQGSIVLAGPSSTAAGGFGGGGIGGAGGATTTSATKQLVAYLEAHRGSAKYIVATFGSQSSASIIVESGMPVITIGGFNGSDPAPTLAQFERLVADGQVRYLLVDGAGAGAGGGGGFGGPGGQGSTGSIATWAAAHGKVVSAASYGGSGTLYDLSGA